MLPFASGGEGKKPNANFAFPLQAAATTTTTVVFSSSVVALFYKAVNMQTPLRGATFNVLVGSFFFFLLPSINILMNAAVIHIVNVMSVLRVYLRKIRKIISSYISKFLVLYILGGKTTS